MVQPTEVFSFPVLMWSNHRTGQFCGSTEAAVSQAEPDPNHTSCPCNDCTNHHKFLWGEITLTVPLQQIKNRLLTFCNKDFYRITSLPSHFSLPSFQNQRKTSLGFENITWCQGKISQFRFKHLFWRFKIMLTGSFIAHKISHMYSCELWDLLWGFFSERQEWCRWCLLMFGH